MDRTTGVHHVSAICTDAQRNIDFYTRVLGLRLVKLTVNFDDPRSYHLYYGDELGRPGTALTFFSWPRAHPGRIGPPQATTTALSVPKGSLDFWRQRLIAHGVSTSAPTTRFGDSLIEFADHDGTRLELVEPAFHDERPGWARGGIDLAHAIRGLHAVTLAEGSIEPTAQVLTRLLGFEPAGVEGDRARFIATQRAGGVVDIVLAPSTRQGSLGAGAVHHVAFRAIDDDAQIRWRKRLANAGLDASPIMDRAYFHSIYFREPGGVLFEIATDGPGFTIDEGPDALGSALRLPKMYAPQRAEIERALHRVRLPAADAM